MEMNVLEGLSFVLLAATMVHFIVISGIWLRRFDHFPIKERSSRLVLTMNSALFLLVLCEYWNYYANYLHPTQGSSNALQSSSTIFLVARKLITWPHILRTLRILFAFKLSHIPPDGQTLSWWKRFLFWLASNELALIFFALAFCTGTSIFEFQWLNAQSGTIIDAFFSNSAALYATVYGTIELTVLLTMAFKLRQVHPDHNIMSELVQIISILFLFSNLWTLVGQSSLICREKCLWYTYLQVFRFWAYVIVTMHVPLRRARKSYLLVCPRNVFTDFRMFIRLREYSNFYLDYLRQTRGQNALDMVEFLDRIDVLRKRDQGAAPSDLVDLYNDYFIREVSLFTPKIENDVRLKRYVGGVEFSLATFMDAVDYTRTHLTEIFIKEFATTTCYIELFRRCQQNTRFIDNLVRMNMILT